DWLPLAVPAGPKARYYGLQPKQLRDAYRTPEEFAVDRHWLNPRRQLSEMKEACESAGCRLIVAYAPTKAYVMLPPVAERLPAEKVRAFMSLRYRKALPEPDQFLKELLNRLGARERVVRTWCKRESIPFIRLTGALRDRAMRGVQVYYTYDQHWTPEGHEVVADRVARFLADLAADRRANAGGRGEPHRIAHSRDAAPGR
ncbi:MAG: hypothetical protein ACE5EX_04105, partial [Phycisphaerae bacterium]